jgi:hypothetical protein
MATPEFKTARLFLAGRVVFFFGIASMFFLGRMFGYE